MMFGLFALATAAIFFGAAFYVNFAEQSARLSLDDRSLLASLACRHRLCQLIRKWANARGPHRAWPCRDPDLHQRVVQTGVWLWLAGALVLVANWPYTLLVIVPTNNTLMATDPAQANPKTRQLIRKWGRLHAVRTALGLAATLIFISVSLR